MNTTIWFLFNHAFSTVASVSTATKHRIVVVKGRDSVVKVKSRDNVVKVKRPT